MHALLRITIFFFFISHFGWSLSFTFDDAFVHTAQKIFFFLLKNMYYHLSVYLGI